MFLYQVLSFFAQLFLMPFFIRVLFRFHGIPFQNAVHLAILQLTNRFIYPLSRRISASGRFDWPAIVLIFLTMLVMTQFRSFMAIGHSLGILTSTLLVLVEALNRICIIYISSGLLSYSSLLLGSNSNKQLLDTTYELTNWQFKKISYFMRQVPFLRQHFLKAAFWVWLLIMIMINLSLERFIYKLVFWG